jgi:hypothetical protein
MECVSIANGYLRIIGMAVKRDATDKALSDSVRASENYTCERCGKYYPEGHGRKGLHCSHYRGRSGKSTRWHPDNLDCLCYGCHMYFSGERFEYDAWKRKKLGDDRYDRLVLRANKPKKTPKWEQLLIRKHYQSEFKRIQDERKNGKQGHIRIIPYD